MAHTMELAVDSALEKKWADEKEEKNIRWLKVEIKEEKLSLTGSSKEGGGEAAMKELAGGCADDPFYGIVRGTDDNEWVVVAFIPDTAKVKSRMQYASTLNHLKKVLGASVIGDVRCSEKDEITWSTVEELVSKKKGKTSNEDAMTDKEKEMASLNAEVAKEMQSADKHSAIENCALKFPIADEAKAALEKGSKNEDGHTVVVLDTENEKITLCSKHDSLQSAVDSLGDGSRFICLNHKNENDDNKECQVFVYYASDSCPFKKRLQYASSKSTAVEHASNAGYSFAKTLEFTEKSEVCAKEINEALKPSAEEDEPKRIKPKAPGRGGMRMLI
eukprot:TRINITY_DN538_c11_g1_i1.p1 TRINITY_DN538_c11_g1~~TRINITY_DN538_c11_g1_i1.p1  ORF type:complete len:332 (+),score=113.08 TRINITY_DN538_c11_g1_i1:54-1049(+)